MKSNDKNRSQKLQLNKETVRSLQPAELDRVGGGRRQETGLSVCYCETDLCPTRILCTV